MLRLSRLLWILLLVSAFLALGNDRAEAKTGLASWYGPGFEGLATASGEPFDPYGGTRRPTRRCPWARICLSATGAAPCR